MAAQNKFLQEQLASLSQGTGREALLLTDNLECGLPKRVADTPLIASGIQQGPFDGHLCHGKRMDEDDTPEEIRGGGYAGQSPVGLPLDDDVLSVDKKGQDTSATDDLLPGALQGR